MVDKKGLTRTGEVKDPFVLSFCSDIIKTYIDKANKEDISKWSIKELVDFLEKIVYTATIYVYMGGAYLCIY